MKRLIIVAIILGNMLFGNICYANITFPIPREDIIVNIWNDCDDINADVYRLKKDIVRLVVIDSRNQKKLEFMNKKFKALASLNELLLIDVIKSNNFEKIVFLRFTLELIIFNIILMISVILYMEYRIKGIKC